MSQEQPNTLGVLSLIFGILSIFILGIPFSILAMTLGALSWDTGLGMSGVITGIIGLFTSPTFWILLAIIF